MRTRSHSRRREEQEGGDGAGVLAVAGNGAPQQQVQERALDWSPHTRVRARLPVYGPLQHHDARALCACGAAPRMCGVRAYLCDGLVCAGSLRAPCVLCAHGGVFPRPRCVCASLRERLRVPVH